MNDGVVGGTTRWGEEEGTGIVPPITGQGYLYE